MTRFGVSLRFAELSAVVELLGEVKSTGRLRLTSGDWTGEIVVRRGRIVDASLGKEQGSGALEGIAIGFADGDLHFADGPVAEDAAALLPAEEQADYLKLLGAERRRIGEVVGSLNLVPRLIESGEGSVLDGHATIGAATLSIIPLLIHSQTIEEIARRRGLARTLREIAVLVRGGVVTLETRAEPVPAHEIARPIRLLQVTPPRRPVTRPRLHPRSRT